MNPIPCSTIGIGLGSNSGDRLALLRTARDRLATLPGVTHIDQSTLYQTEPVDVRPEHAQTLFLNAAVLLRGQMDLPQIWNACRSIETALGRVRTHDHHAPRTIDLDLLFADALVLHTPDLQIPHPRWHERRFVVAPLADLIPNHRIPLTHFTIAQLLATLPHRPEVFAFMTHW